jgi:hypothetical protein
MIVNDKNLGNPAHTASEGTVPTATPESYTRHRLDSKKNVSTIKVLGR